MKTITVTIMTVLFALSAAITVAQTKESNGTNIVVAENIIEAVNNIDIISLNVLLAEGASADTVDEAGNSPLILATRIGNPRMIRIILAHSPEIDHRNNNGDTALMVAAEYGILPIVRELTNAGADAQQRNSDGLTPGQIAQRNGHGAVAQFLNSNSDSASISR